MGRIEHIEFSARHNPDGFGHPAGSFRVFAIEDIFCGLVAEFEDHEAIY